MERDMALFDPRKVEFRARWRQNETEYLREQRRKVNQLIRAIIRLYQWITLRWTVPRTFPEAVRSPSMHATLLKCRRLWI
jgi:hypothetical protein